MTGPFVRLGSADEVLRARRVVLAPGSPAATAALLPDGAPAVVVGPRSGRHRRAASTSGCAGCPRPARGSGSTGPTTWWPTPPAPDLAPDGTAFVHAMRNLHHDETTGADELAADLHALARRTGITEDDVVIERYLHRMVVVSASVTPTGGGLAGRPAVHDTGRRRRAGRRRLGRARRLARRRLAGERRRGRRGRRGGGPGRAERLGREPTVSDAARAERFTEERPRLVGLAYRMLGSRTDAEDVVQEAWIRYAAAAVEPDNPAAWLTTVTSRLALDRMRSAPVRRERYVGPVAARAGPHPVRRRAGRGRG